MTEHTISIRDQICLNKRCLFYQKRLGGNVIVHGQKYSRFKCKGCKKTWVSTRHHFHYGIRKDLKKFELALELLRNGLSIRKIAQKVGVNPGTVQRWKKKQSIINNFIH